MRQEPRSLKHEYQLYVEREIEAYKESLPRSVLLSIGDEAVAVLASEEQVALTELLLCARVDIIIMRRLGLAKYKAWRERRLRRLAKYSRPEHWGFEPDAPIVRALECPEESHVLVAGVDSEGSALFLAARGHEVTTVEPQEDAVERVMSAAFDTGITSRVHGCVSDLASYAPVAPLAAVVCTPAAFAGLTAEERARAIQVLKSATRDGGVHLVETIVAGQAALTVDELSEQYAGWQLSVESCRGASQTFLARKLIA